MVHEALSTENRRLQLCLNDLMALPAIWVGRDRVAIVESLLDSLMSLLRLDLAFLHLNASDGGSPIEAMRHSTVDGNFETANRLLAQLRAFLGAAAQDTPERVEFGADLPTIAQIRLDPGGEIGLLVVGSSREDFPLQTELLLLGVAANLATVALANVRPEEEEKGAVERRQQERDQQAKDYLLNGVAEAIASPFVFLKPDGEVEVANQRLLNFYGKTREEIQNWKANEMLHPDDRERTVATVKNAMTSGLPYEIEARRRRADGVFRWWRSNGYPMRNADGDIIRWCVLYTDIHDRRQAEDALVASERRLQQIIGTLPALVWSARSDGSVEFVNQYFLDYVGLAMEEVLDWAWTGAVHPDDLPRLVEDWRRIMASGGPGESMARLRGAEGQYRRFMFRTNPITDEAGTTRWLGINFDVEDMKRAEESLRASELNLRLLTETIPQMLWSATSDGAIEYCNARLLEYTGLDADVVKCDGWVNMLHPDDRAPTARIWQRCVMNGDPYQVEVRTLHAADGTYRWCLTDALPLRDDSGRILKWHGTCVDIHDRKLAEEARAATERKLDQIINTIPAVAWSSEPDGYTDFINKHYLDYVGLPFDEVKGWGWANALHPDDAKGLRAKWDEMRTTGRGGTAEARLRRFDGVYRWYLFHPNPLYDEAGNVIKWYGVNVDIEDLKRTELNLHRLTETIPQMLWSAAADGLLEYCNRRLVDFTGVAAQSIMGDGWKSLLHPDDVEHVARIWEISITTGDPFHVEARIIHAADGAYRWCLADALPLYDEDGRILKWHGACVDMHNWRQAQHELRETQAELAHVTRVVTMGHLTASIAHELNQPLSGIVTNASTCLRMLAANPPNITGAQETARRMIRDGNRAADVIARLRSLFSKKAPIIEAVDLNAATQEVIALLAAELQKARVSLSTELMDGLPLVKGDRVQLQQVIMNLLLNALQAMDGVIDRPKDLAVATIRDGTGHVCIVVKDAGVGLDSEAVERIFNPFYTTKSNGMGIGLSVSRSIVENHLGRLWAEANQGPGATFLVSIPVESGAGVESQ